MKATLKKIRDRLLAIARSPAFKPVEVWALRAVMAYVTVKLGIDASKL